MKKINLNQLSMSWNEKQTPQRFGRYAAMLIMLLTLGVGQMWADTSTFYLALDASKTRNNNNCCTVYSNVKRGDNNWQEITLTKTSYTYNGKVVYQGTHDFTYGGYNNWQFYLKENGNQHWYKEIYAGSWNSTLHNGQLYVYENSNWVSSPSWDAPYTVYYVNSNNWGAVRAYAWNNECDYNAGYPGAELTYTGCKSNGHDIYKITLNKRYSYIQFNCNSGDCKTGDLNCYSNAGKMYNGSSWVTPAISGYTISSGATVVWDAGNESWTTANLYYYDLTSDGYDDYTRISSTTQFYKTYSSAVSTKAAWIFRKAHDWTAQTTDINSDISGVTLFTYCNSTTDGKLDWQKTTSAKKATYGVKVYFDNTASNWSEIWLKYGTQWYNRHSGSAASKVTGTENLYVITIPNDVYYEKYVLANNYGYTGYNNITADNNISHRIAHQAANIASEITYIPTTGTGSGTAGSPKVWSFNTINGGHKRTLTFGDHENGNITVRYTDENGVEHTVSSASASSVDVAQTCNVVITAVPNSGYAPSGLELNSSSIISGATQTIREDGTIDATFVAEETHDVTVSYKYGTRSLHDAQTFEVGVTTASDISAEAIDGFSFSNWSNLTNVTNNSANLTTNPININTIVSGSDGSMTCNYTPWTCSLDIVPSEGATSHGNEL